MAESTEVRDERYRVVVNLEEQYSIWADGRELPAGWSDARTPPMSTGAP